MGVESSQIGRSRRRRTDRGQVDEATPLTVAPTQPRPGLVAVRVLGELDLCTPPRLARVLAAAIRKAGGSAVGAAAGRPATGAL